MNYREYIKKVIPDIDKNVRPLQSKYFLEAIEHDLRMSSIPVDFSKEGWLVNIPAKPGIYFFEANFSNWQKPWDDFVNDFEQLWKNRTNQIGACPRFNRGKAAAVADKFSGTKILPFYIGIRNNIQSRVKEHVFGPSDPATSALRLMARQGDISTVSFSVHNVEIDIPESMHFILAIIEAGLIDRIKPITGKKSWKVFEN